MSLIRSFTRLYSQTAKSAKNATGDVSKVKLQKALELLKDSKFNLKTITDEEKQTYVRDFTQILSTGLNGKHETSSVKHHFDQSLDGLNHLLTANSHITTQKMPSRCNFKELKQLVNSVDSTESLLNIFDDLVHNNSLSGKNLRLILWNEYSSNSLKHIQNKIEFINTNGELDKFMILVFHRAGSLKAHKLVNELYKKYMDRWVSLRNNGQLLPFFERSLYKSMKFSGLKLTDMLETLEFTSASYILLIEALPQYIKTYISADFYKSATFSKNQKVFIETLLYFHEKPIFTNHKVDTKPMIQTLLKISVMNKIHTESPQEDLALTMHKHRFQTEMNTLFESLIASLDNNMEIVRLLEMNNESNESTMEQTVLRFV